MSPRKMRLRLRHDLGFERTYFLGCLVCVMILFGASTLGWRLKQHPARLLSFAAQRPSENVNFEDYFSKAEIEEFKQTYGKPTGKPGVPK